MGQSGLCRLIRGQQIAQRLLTEVKADCDDLRRLIKPHPPPTLAVAVMGDDPATAQYIRAKRRVAAEVGVRVIVEKAADEGRLRSLIDDLNQDRDIHGVIVQLPLIGDLDEREMCNLVTPKKDVDGFTAVNLGSCVQSQFEEVKLSHVQRFIPCTVAAVKTILRGQDLTHVKKAVVIGRSLNVGLPVGIMLQADGRKGGFDMTVTMCHRNTEHLKEHTLKADLIVSAVGKAGLVTREMVKPGAGLVDIGITRVRGQDGKVKLKGDFHEDVMDVAGWMTPVPGGVGPVTVACLMRNTVLAARREFLNWPI